MFQTNQSIYVQFGPISKCDFVEISSKKCGVSKFSDWRRGRVELPIQEKLLRIYYKLIQHSIRLFPSYCPLNLRLKPEGKVLSKTRSFVLKIFFTVATSNIIMS